MKVDYACMKCDHRFGIDITESESRSRLAEDRTDACPECNQRVGTGPVRCEGCGATFMLGFPHWHVHCDLAGGDCPACGARYVSLCIC